jgi:hypothetical protein
VSVPEVDIASDDVTLAVVAVVVPFVVVPFDVADPLPVSSPSTTHVPPNPDGDRAW